MKTPEQILESVISYGCDAESIVAAYKEAASYAKAYKDAQDKLKEMAEAILVKSEVISLKTESGTIGWTQPKKGKLDEATWQEALAEDEDLRKVVAAYEMAEENLKMAQAEFLVLPEPQLYIR